MSDKPRMCQAHFRLRELACIKSCGETCIVADPEKVNASLARLMAENERLLRENKWIAVADRVPADTEEYLVWPPGKYNKPIAIMWPYEPFKSLRKNMWYWEDDFGVAREQVVTHWRALPAGPVEALKGEPK